MHNDKIITIIECFKMSNNRIQEVIECTNHQIGTLSNDWFPSTYRITDTENRERKQRLKEDYGYNFLSEEESLVRLAFSTNKECVCHKCPMRSIKHEKDIMLFGCSLLPQGEQLEYPAMSILIHFVDCPIQKKRNEKITMEAKC